MRIICQPLHGGFELCARLGLVFAPSLNPAYEHAVACVRRFILAQSEGYERIFGLARRHASAQAALEPVALVHANGGKVIHAALENSPSARTGLAVGDIVVGINDVRWISSPRLIFSDRRSSELKLTVFVARYVSILNVTVRVSPEPYRTIEDIVAEAMTAVPCAAAAPSPAEVSRP